MCKLNGFLFWTWFFNLFLMNFLRVHKVFWPCPPPPPPNRLRMPVTQCVLSQNSASRSLPISAQRPLSAFHSPEKESCVAQDDVTPTVHLRMTVNWVSRLCVPSECTLPSLASFFWMVSEFAVVSMDCIICVAHPLLTLLIWNQAASQFSTQTIPK